MIIPVMKYSTLIVIFGAILWTAPGSATPDAAIPTLPHPYYLAQPDSAPTRLLALVEIPAGSFTKYELDKRTGHVVVDRFLTTPTAYPANYGSLPSIFAEDGDPVDILIFTRTPVAPGALIEVRPIGSLRMRDRGEADDKIIAVPADDVDPFYRAVRDIKDLPAEARAGIEAFFRNYKSNDPADRRVTTHGFVGEKTTLEELKRYLGHIPPSEATQ
ncbi:inorganic diphosphatase [Exilibacterium tricleocarpae]|uniref:Inorganic pyrophosphatase n=1 Tax=Exilibacterium tricleocarpae TaxID=2591008 RepID=A0A545ST24_9GAMM|nr:inorganic diphosphatase [Exilibacterium tricleocarpae]TQV68114.1 inorganic diphosphatase [Exilibacterium tricleocarpae]